MVPASIALIICSFDDRRYCIRRVSRAGERFWIDPLPWRRAWIIRALLLRLFDEGSERMVPVTMECLLILIRAVTDD